MTHRFSSMGVEVSVSGATDAERRAIEQLFAEHDRTFSPFRRNSELSALNRRAGRLAPVSPLFAKTLGVALEAARQTDGMVDPTLGGALTPDGLDRCWRPGIWREVRLHGPLVLVPRGVSLDLNGVVKALSVDRAFALLSAGTGFVCAGGDLRTRGPLSVSLPSGDEVTLHAGALATSGTTKRGRHLIDAASGRACEGPWREVTACGETCLDADIAAKAGFLAGDDGPDWLDRISIPACFLSHDGESIPNDAWLASMSEPVAACT